MEIAEELGHFDDRAGNLSDFRLASVDQSGRTIELGPRELLLLLLLLKLPDRRLRERNARFGVEEGCVG